MVRIDGGSGVFEEGCHILPQRVYYEHTDAGGIVYHGTYLRFADRARTELIRALGFENSWLQNEHGLVMAVRRCQADYYKPAVLDDLLNVRTAVLRVGGASVEFEQTIRRDGTDLARLEIKLGCMTLLGRPARLPQVVRHWFADPRLANGG